MSEKDIQSADTYLDDIPDLFRVVLSATADGVVITDKDGNIKWVNSAYEKITGYSIQDVVNKNPRILKSGKQNPTFYEDLWDTISSGNVWNGELWNKRKDGVIYLEEQSITPVFNEQKQVTHYIAIKRDVTQQHRLQEQLHQAKRIEAIGQLTAGVAHNFNNKLASILGFSELALEDAKQYENEELDDSLNEIIIAGKSARDLVRQMMAFSLNELTELKLCNIGLVIKQVIKLISSTIPSSIKVVMNLREVPQVMLDPVRLHQMLISMAMNSSEAMSGNGELTFTTNIIKLTNTECNSCHELIDGDYVSISVNDTGKGISPDNLDKIFMPFFTTRNNEGGTGMGLSALHGMMHEMNGHVLVESVPEQNTVFTLLFPISAVSKDMSITDSEVSANNEDKDDMHILLVDDEEAVVNFLVEILKMNGFHVTGETNSKNALKHISEHPGKYDLLITDQNMPDLNGLELSKLVNDIRKDLPVILMSGHQIDKDNKEFEQIKSVLTKPFDTKELIKKVKQI